MLENIEWSLVNWSRAQFALTAMFHWLFVPLTLGLSFMLAFFETIYVKTGNEEWKHLTRFWMTLFGINFAIGVAEDWMRHFPLVHPIGRVAIKLKLAGNEVRHDRLA